MDGTRGGLGAEEASEVQALGSGGRGEEYGWVLGVGGGHVDFGGLGESVA